MSMKEITSNSAGQVQNMYVCQTTIQGKEGFSATMTGEGRTIQEASEMALSNMQRELERLTSQSSCEQPKHQQANKDFYGASNKRQTPQSKDALNGGGAKPASDKQIEFLLNVGGQRGIPVEQLCQERYGKSIGNLTGGEANTLIRELKS